MSKSDLTVLNKCIIQLGKRWDELKALSLTTNPLDKKLEILDQMELINIRITRLETLRNHLEAAIITVAPPSAEDRKQFEDSLATLSKQVSKDMRWAAALKLTKNFMIAVHNIQTNIAGRQERMSS